MKNGNVTVMAVGLVLIASIAFAGGYFLALDGGSSFEDVKILRETVARQKKAIETSGGRATQGGTRFTAPVPELNLPKNSGSGKSVRALLFQARADSRPEALL